MKEISLDYRYLKAFMSTAKHLNFSKAAEELNIAQSALAPKVMPDGYKVQYYPADTPECQLIDIIES
jgi:hypothetical protein